ncbi:MAG: hypothetical protein JOY99_02915 [Sphingomonadaceae bacterium]|nr:hypothetical protein [Sphingomonadaceae bacterium]
MRIGIMGLAGVFLLVVLAAALYSLFGKPHAPLIGNAAATDNAADAPKEPLAELGVAPGNVPPDATTAARKTTPKPGGRTAR